MLGKVCLYFGMITAVSSKSKSGHLVNLFGVMWQIYALMHYT